MAGDVNPDLQLTNHIRRQTQVNNDFYCLDFDMSTGAPPFNLLTTVCDATKATQKWDWTGTSTSNAAIRSKTTYTSTDPTTGASTTVSLCIDTGSTAGTALPTSGTQATVAACSSTSGQQTWWKILGDVTIATITNMRAQGTFPQNRIDCLMLDQTWAKTDAFEIAPPDCLKPQLSRTNQLGNAADETLSFSVDDMTSKAVPQTLNANRYLWTVPNDIDENCVLRVRYNISTSDYEDWIDESPSAKVGVLSDGQTCMADGCAYSRPGVDWRQNGANSPIKQDPYMQIGPDANTDFVSMAVNTNQYGRTFQDRSYVFAVRPKPAGVSGKVFNVNVRGKRGNIVQTYPAVEYDFVPNALELEQGDFVHFQWTGSDYNPRRGPNDAEGGPPDANTLDPAQAQQNQRADRSNLVQMTWGTDQLPAPQAYTAATYNGGDAASTTGVPNTKLTNGAWGSPSTTNSMFATSSGECDTKCQESTRRLAMLNQVAWLTQRTDAAAADRRCLTQTELNNIGNEQQRENHPRNCAKLNAQFTPYFDNGPIEMRTKGSFAFFSSRNNNFSNRDQTGMICVGGTEGCQDGAVTSDAASFKSVADIANADTDQQAGLAVGLFFLGGFLVWSAHFGYAKYAATKGRKQLYTDTVALNSPANKGGNMI